MAHMRDGKRHLYSGWGWPVPARIAALRAAARSITLRDPDWNGCASQFARAAARRAAIRSICPAAFCCLVLCAASHAATPASPDLAGVEVFERKIRPILVENCYKCHSANAEKIKGGLLLDTREGVLKGGETGPAIVPGEPEKSLLIKAVRYTDENLQMPPKNKKLASDQIAALEQWVKMGAPDPRQAGMEKSSPSRSGLDHWAFRPVKRAFIPEVKDPGWIQ